MATLKEIARLCGVSPATVSRVLNNRPGEVGPATRARILDTVRGLGYRPPAAHRSVRSPATVGVVAGLPFTAFTGETYYRRILDSILLAVDRLEQNCLIFTHQLFSPDGSGRDPHQAIRTFYDGRCDGLIVIVPNQDSRFIGALRERGLPFVIAGAWPETPETRADLSVDVDNVETYRRLTLALLDQGHRRLAFLGDIQEWDVVAERRRGWREALSEHGVTPDPAWGLEPTPDEVEVCVREMMSLAPARRPTALLCWEDCHAARTLATLRTLGLRVPADVSLAGFNDLEVASLDPPLTTVRQPYAEIGRVCVEMLLAQIAGRDIPVRRVRLPGELVFRASTAPAR